MLRTLFQSLLRGARRSGKARCIDELFHRFGSAHFAAVHHHRFAPIFESAISAGEMPKLVATLQANLPALIQAEVKYGARIAASSVR